MIEGLIYLRLKQIADGKAELEQSKAQIADGRIQLENGKKQLEESKAQLEEGQKAFVLNLL